MEIVSTGKIIFNERLDTTTMSDVNKGFDYIA
jgi:hypothetical protein